MLCQALRAQVLGLVPAPGALMLQARAHFVPLMQAPLHKLPQECLCMCPCSAKRRCRRGGCKQVALACLPLLLLPYLPAHLPSA